MSDLRHFRNRAREILANLDTSRELNVRETVRLLHDLDKSKDKPVREEKDNHRLAQIVYESVDDLLDKKLSIVGTELSKLLGALLKNGFVRWKSNDLPQLYFILKRIFPIEHPVWSFIAIMGGPNGANRDTQRT